jgi:hypothetical protein
MNEEDKELILQKEEKAVRLVHMRMAEKAFKEHWSWDIKDYNKHFFYDREFYDPYYEVSTYKVIRKEILEAKQTKATIPEEILKAFDEVEPLFEHYKKLRSFLKEQIEKDVQETGILLRGLKMALDMMGEENE